MFWNIIFYMEFCILEECILGFFIFLRRLIDLEFMSFFLVCLIYVLFLKRKKKILKKNNILIEWIFYEWESIYLFNFDDIEDLYEVLMFMKSLMNEKFKLVI